MLCNFAFSCSTFEINDYPYHLFKAFISYFYTDTVDLPSEDLPGLFCVATKPFYHKGEAVLYTLYIQFVGKPDISAKVSGAKVRHMCTCIQLDAVPQYNI